MKHLFCSCLTNQRNLKTNFLDFPPSMMSLSLLINQLVLWDIDFETGFGTLFTVKLKTPEHRTKSVSKTDVYETG